MMLAENKDYYPRFLIALFFQRNIMEELIPKSHHEM